MTKENDAALRPISHLHFEQSLTAYYTPECVMATEIFVPVDNTLLSSVAECSTKTILARFLGYRGISEAATLRAGSAVHLALAAWFSGASIHAAMLEFLTDYQSWSDENLTPDHRLWWENVYKVLFQWFQSHPPASFEFTVPDETYIEIPFAVRLTTYKGRALVFVGRIDGVVKQEGRYYVFEHKTTGRLDASWPNQFMLSSQITGYVWAIRSWLAAKGIDPDLLVGAIINGIELPKIPTSNRTCKKHDSFYRDCGYLHTSSRLLPVTRSKAEIQAWHTTAIELGRRYIDLIDAYPTRDRLEHVPLEGVFRSYSCSFCTFNDFCKMGRPEKQLDTVLRHDPWSPFDFNKIGREILTDPISC